MADNDARSIFGYQSLTGVEINPQPYAYVMHPDGRGASIIPPGSPHDPSLSSGSFLVGDVLALSLDEASEKVEEIRHHVRRRAAAAAESRAEARRLPRP